MPKKVFNFPNELIDNVGAVVKCRKKFLTFLMN